LSAPEGKESSLRGDPEAERAFEALRGMFGSEADCVKFFERGFSFVIALAEIRRIKEGGGLVRVKDPRTGTEWREGKITAMDEKGIAAVEYDLPYGGKMTVRVYPELLLRWQQEGPAKVNLPAVSSN